MNTKTFNNVRFTPKGDTEANWKKAVGFVPLDREVIIYKPDAKHSAPRIKVGDGVTSVQDLPFVADVEGIAIEKYIKDTISAMIPEAVQVNYEQNNSTAADYIKNRPFYDTRTIFPAKTYILDQSSLAFKIAKKIQIEDDLYLVNISNDILTADQLIGATVFHNSNTITLTESNIELLTDDSTSNTCAIYIFGEDWQPLFIAILDAELFNQRLNIQLHSGLYYFAYANETNYVKLCVPELALNDGELKKLDKKFLPDEIASIEEEFKKYVTYTSAKAHASQIKSIF